MSAQTQRLRARLSELAHNLGVLAFNREQAEMVWRNDSAALLQEMRQCNGQIMALEQSEAEAPAVFGVNPVAARPSQAALLDDALAEARQG